MSVVSWWRSLESGQKILFVAVSLTIIFIVRLTLTIVLTYIFWTSKPYLTPPSTPKYISPTEPINGIKTLVTCPDLGNPKFANEIFYYPLIFHSYVSGYQDIAEIKIRNLGNGYQIEFYQSGEIVSSASSSYDAAYENYQFFHENSDKKVIFTNSTDAIPTSVSFVKQDNGTVRMRKRYFIDNKEVTNLTWEMYFTFDKQNPMYSGC